MKTAIMFPDYKAENTFGEFGKSLRDSYPDAVIIPVLNGLEAKLLDEKAEEARQEGFESAVSTEKGIVAALLKGYEHYRNVGQALPLVRLDTAEHDIKYIPTLAEKAVEINGMVIGDLEFNKEQMPKESIEYFVNNFVFPELYRQINNGKLGLSCAHGYQAFSPFSVGPILYGAHKIIDAVEQEIGNGQMTWGLDGAMALSALLQNIPVEVTKVPGMSERNRNPEKIFQQFSQHLRIIRTFERVFKK